ncbi:hypothetical protein K9U39_12980 [Rhodoblastus acidophilus]|uniref:Uncharacterized protein n=1 Tax=Candidatus Rhodoblastus alkanivorans TaxID=2954117 RepID=A0ABS9ZA07_9HYPH|nr:hypothetical protein [Candidatus Rhodoblastus alkanivorans]MCI4677171.1 hypothetical protein [Candidatus Rhodoblastus alkanivorans]MCI4684524.1 hypothetical protein [Candidatus Rhodoblastus alkanivorans]MDI4641845.1 hypothetical protein [Rhodoblastus acidophilus]
MILTASQANAQCGAPGVGGAGLAAALLSGGDERIAVDPMSGRNRYGLTARPAPDEIFFSSSTASAISPLGWAAAVTAWRRLACETAGERLALPAWFDAIRRRIAAHAGGGEAILAASGTDAELLALALAAHIVKRPITNIVVGPGETGRGVALAAAGLHFQPSARRRRVAGWESLDVAVETVEIRAPDGSPRPPGEVDAEVLAKAEAALARGRGVIAHLLDVSKTGLAGFSRAAALALRARAPERVVVLADCCQMRGAAPLLRDLLDCGFLVSATGSKFFGGPPFSGALLVPDALHARLRDLRLPEGLAAHSALYDWPAPLRGAAAGFGSHANIGLGLRWEAALAEMDRFRAVPPGLAQAITAGFRDLVEADAREAGLTVLGEAGESMDWARTIVPIAARRADGLPLSPEQAEALQRALRRPAEARGYAAKVFHLGQAVAVGSDQALRVCLGAPMLSDIAQRCATGVRLDRALAPLAEDIAALFAKWRRLLR